MEITTEQLQRFIELYEKEFDVVLSPVDAQQSFLSLLRLMAISAKPLELLNDDDSI